MIRSSREKSLHVSLCITLQRIILKEHIREQEPLNQDSSIVADLATTNIGSEPVPYLAHY